MNHNVIITCALTGAGDTAGKNQAVPVTPAQIAAYQNARTDAGRAPKTINGEISVLRQVLKRAKLWYRFADEYKALRNRKAPVGRALSRVTGAELGRRWADQCPLDH